jgi:hypothetical protein
LTITEATELFNDTKLFLYVCGTSMNGGHVPTPLIDKGWHEFLLFTKDYAHFCNSFFGCFIHHNPSKAINESELIEKLRRTRLEAERLSEGPLSNNWQVNRSSIEGFDSCGDDSCGD